LTEPGFFGQSKGRLTKTRYKNSTIFVDHFLRLQYVYLMTSNLTSSKTIDAKRTFKRFAAEHGIKIAHYHCNNGHFADTAFIRSCKESHQKLTFCGVNTHFQKWDRGKGYSRPLRERAKAATPHEAALAAGGEHCSMALRSPLCRLPSQRASGA
jgi:hypothetical protein